MWLPQSNALLGEKEDFDLVLQSGTSRNKYIVLLDGQSDFDYYFWDAKAIAYDVLLLGN